MNSLSTALPAVFLFSRMHRGSRRNIFSPQQKKDSARHGADHRQKCDTEPIRKIFPRLRLSLPWFLLIRQSTTQRRTDRPKNEPTC